MSDRPSKETMTWTDWRGRKVTREVNQVIDIRDFIGMHGYPLLVLAANTHLSVPDLLQWVELNGQERGRSWAYRRRRLFQDPKTVNNPGKPNRDGKDEQARAIMREYHTSSLRYLVRVLKEHGIERGKDWVRANRGL